MTRSMRRSAAGITLMPLVVGTLLIVLGFLSFQFWLFLRLPGSSVRGSRVVEIQSGMGAITIARLLHSEGVISDPRLFYIFCWLHKSGHRLQAGEYGFIPLSTPNQILDQMVNGRVIQHRVTLPEGSGTRDVAILLSRNGLASEEEILSLVRDRDYIDSLGLSVPSLEGYLFPETYSFKKTQTGRSMLKAMVHQFRLHFPQSWRNRSQELGLSVHDVVTLASLVEKEAAVDWERPLIAAVFLNRLERDMPLQSDPSAVYDLHGFSGPITPTELRRDSPYNTYRHKGLPAGPICSPGARSLEAVLFHDDTPYLYFVSNKDGTHHFSESYAEHLQAVSRYRRMQRSTSDRLTPASRHETGPAAEAEAQQATPLDGK